MTCTRHALERLEERRIRFEWAAAAVLWGRNEQHNKSGLLFVCDRRTLRRARSAGYSLPPLPRGERVAAIVKDGKIITAYWL